jgi:hypothetical protein
MSAAGGRLALRRLSTSSSTTLWAARLYTFVADSHSCSWE